MQGSQYSYEGNGKKFLFRSYYSNATRASYPKRRARVSIKNVRKEIRNMKKIC